MLEQPEQGCRSRCGSKSPNRHQRVDLGRPVDLAKRGPSGTKRGNCPHFEDSCARLRCECRILYLYGIQHVKKSPRASTPGPHLPRPHVSCGPHARGVGPHTAGAVPTPGPHYEARGVPQGGVPGLPARSHVKHDEPSQGDRPIFICTL